MSPRTGVGGGGHPLDLPAADTPDADDDRTELTDAELANTDADAINHAPASCRRCASLRVRKKRGGAARDHGSAQPGALPTRDLGRAKTEAKHPEVRVLVVGIEAVGVTLAIDGGARGEMVEGWDFYNLGGLLTELAGGSV